MILDVNELELELAVRDWGFDTQDIRKLLRNTWTDLPMFDTLLSNRVCSV